MTWADDTASGEKKLRPSDGEGPAFRDGDHLGRYVIVRFIARGGMGEVYEAEDLELSVRVALKTLRREIIDRPGMLERQKREIQLARKITHRHVCRIFDLGRHGDTTFLTMQLVEGETLAQRLARAGRMTPDEALPIALDLAAALEALHAAGVVHRDLKSANVIVGPDGPVVTDFGLARDLAGGGELLSTSGGLIGTPAYMAPEQVAGGAVGPASDVYALGVILYELLTGERPWKGAGAAAVAAQRLHEDAPAPSGAPARWAELIRDCLARAPERRPTAVEIVRRLTAPPRRRRGVLVVAAAAVLAAGAVVATLAARRAPVETPLPPLAAGARRSVAVLDFAGEGQRPEDAWIARALPEMLSADLGAGEALRVVPRQEIERARVDLGIAAGSLAPGADLARRIGADVLVSGRYAVESGRLRVDLRVGDAAFTERAPVDGLVELVARAGTGVRRRLGAASPDGGSKLPANAAAARHFAAGLDALRRDEVIAARDALLAAVAADPGFARAHLVLAEAWQQLGYEARARDAVEVAYRLSDGSDRQERLVIEASRLKLRGEPERAADSYQTLWRFFPDNPEYGMLLARAEITAGRWREALVTVSALRALPPPRGDDPRIDLLEAEAAMRGGDQRHRLEAAGNAARRALARGMKLSVALARQEEGWAHYLLGERDAAIAAFAEALRFAAEAQAPRAQSYANLAQGTVRSSAGDLRGARPFFEEALRLRRDSGDSAGTAEILGELSFLDIESERVADARRRAEESAAIARELGAAQLLDNALTFAGIAALAAGDTAAAIAACRQAMAGYEARGHAFGAGRAKVALALALALAGELDEAERELKELVFFTKLASRPYASYPLLGLADVRLSRGALDAARTTAEEALAIIHETRQDGVEPDARLLLGQIALAAGRRDDAAAAGAYTAERYAAMYIPGRQARGLALRAQALATSDRATARAAADDALAIGGASEMALTWFATRLAAIEVGLGGDAAEQARARALAEEVLAAAARLKMVREGLTAELLLGRLDLAAGTGPARLRAAQRRAAERGYKLLVVMSRR